MSRLPTYFYKAQPIVRGAAEVSDLYIRAGTPVPSLSDLLDMRALFAKEARNLADALQESLPGGTIDALLVELLDRKRALLVVPFLSSRVSEASPAPLDGQDHAAMERVRRVMDDRKGFDTSDLDGETLADLLAAIVRAVRGDDGG